MHAARALARTHVARRCHGTCTFASAGLEHRDRGALCRTTAPGVLDADADPHSRSPDHVPQRQAAILDAQSGRRQIEAVVPQGNGERASQVARPPAQLLGRKVFRAAGRSSRAPSPHDRRPVKRLERTNQHRRGRAGRLGHRVHQVVNAVIQVDVGESRGSIERCIANGRTRGGVTGGIGLADVGLGLDDDAGRQAAGALVHEHLANQLPRDVERRPRVERARQDHCARRILMRSTARLAASAAILSLS